MARREVGEDGPEGEAIADAPLVQTGDGVAAWPARDRDRGQRAGHRPAVEVAAARGAGDRVAANVLGAIGGDRRRRLGRAVLVDGEDVAAHLDAVERRVRAVLAERRVASD